MARFKPVYSEHPTIRCIGTAIGRKGAQTGPNVIRTGRVGVQIPPEGIATGRIVIQTQPKVTTIGRKGVQTQPIVIQTGLIVQSFIDSSQYYKPNNQAVR